MLYIGCDVGGTNIRTAVVDENGKILGDARMRALMEKGPNVVLGQIADSFREALSRAKAKREDVIAAGIAMAGQHDSKNGICIFSPNFGWENVPVIPPLQEQFPVPMFLGNDVNLAAFGEWKFGAGKGYKWVVMITLGTGIGGGAILDGKLMLGATEMFAEVGHMTILPDGPRCGCGNHGCWEALAGRDAIVRRAIQKLQTGRKSSLLEIKNYHWRDLNPEIIAKEAYKGDEVARETIEETGYWVGIGVANLINIFNPELFIIGGRIALAGELLFGAIERTVKARGLSASWGPCKIVPAALGDDAGILGAVAYAMDKLGEEK
ncbi:ROK family protein [bacterium]|nr:ROK family protein [bacterium]